MKRKTLNLNEKDLISNTEKVIEQVHKLWRNEDSLFNPALVQAVKDTELSILNIGYNNERKFKK